MSLQFQLNGDNGASLHQEIRKMIKRKCEISYTDFPLTKEQIKDIANKQSQRPNGPVEELGVLRQALMVYYQGRVTGTVFVTL